MSISISEMYISRQDDRYEIEYFRGRRDYWNSLGKEDPLKDQISEYLKNKGLVL